MYLTFVTNYMNHHTQPLAEALYQRLGREFCLVETRPMRGERLDMGWEQAPDQPYLLRAYESAQRERQCRKLALESCVLILGGAPDGWMLPRLQAEKLTLRYAERWYKTPLTWKTMPRAKLGAWLHHGRFRKKPLYLLCASAYTAADAAITGNYLGKAYRWGYFPAVSSAPPEPRNDSPTRLLWAGRMVSLKHPEDAIALAAQLLERDYDVTLDMIGTGPELEPCRAQARPLGNRVRFLGPMGPEQVRRHMENAHMFLFTSDRAEGWGAVLNEAMASGCAVLASHAPGATPYLLRHGENGLIYPSGSRAALLSRAKQLLDAPQAQAAMGMAAWRTMAESWNPGEASRRLLALTEALLAGGEGELFPDGPCSPAPLLSENWIWEGSGL